MNSLEASRKKLRKRREKLTMGEKIPSLINMR